MAIDSQEIPATIGVETGMSPRNIIPPGWRHFSSPYRTLPDLLYGDLSLYSNGALVNEVMANQSGFAMKRRFALQFSTEAPARRLFCSDGVLRVELVDGSLLAPFLPFPARPRTGPIHG